MYLKRPKELTPEERAAMWRMFRVLQRACDLCPAGLFLMRAQVAYGWRC